MRKKERVTQDLKAEICIKIEIGIYAENNKCYKAILGVKPRGPGYFSFPYITQIREINGENKTKKYRINAKLGIRPMRYPISFFAKLKYQENLKKFLGLDIIINEYSRNEKKVIKGKIISVSPKIIGTSPGSGGLPPINE